MPTQAPLHNLCTIVLASLVAGCSYPSVTTRYQPLHPGNNVDVTFRVDAGDGDGVEVARLYIYEHELSVQNGMQTATQRPGGIWGLQQTWNYPTTPTSISETYTHSGFPASSFVRYLFTVTDTENRTRSEEWWFAAGNWPFGNSPIPILGNGAPAERIDVCFVADNTDYTNGAGMLPDLVGLVFDGYHVNNAIRGSWRKYWQFYYSPETGFISDFDTPPLTMTIPASVSGAAIIDHAAVIHTTVKRDWASGGNFGTEPTNIGTAVHESAHAAFGLSDEYSGGGHSTSSNPHHNNYSSQTDAENYNTANGWPASDVESIQPGWWRPEPATLACIMLNDGDATMPDFERTCLARASWFYQQL
ncbi:MAG: hypothetical protein ACREQ8_14830 [Woeseiaceae bacterium]